jgi:hypothetical protein
MDKFCVEDIITHKDAFIGRAYGHHFKIISFWNKKLPWVK